MAKIFDILQIFSKGSNIMNNRQETHILLMDNQKNNEFSQYGEVTESLQHLGMWWNNNINKAIALNAQELTN